MLKKVDVVNGRVEAVDHAGRSARVTTQAGTTMDIGYDVLVVALGSVARTLPIPGLAEVGIGFKQVEEAISLRNHVLDQMDLAHSTNDPATRRRALTFVVVGGGYAGVEALAELEDLSRYATRFYADLEPSDLHWMLVEASGRILPEVGEDMGRYTVEQLRKRKIDVRLDTLLKSCVGGHVVLERRHRGRFGHAHLDRRREGKPGARRHRPAARRPGSAALRRGPRVEGAPGVFAAGDCAAVPDLTGPPGAFCSPSAQHAVRQAKVLGDNVVAYLRGEPVREYRHKYVGSVASLGLHKGVAQVYGIKLSGFVAWFMHRTYHVSRVPTFNRKVRVIADWTLALFFRRDVVSLGRLSDPRREFRRAVGPPPWEP